MAKTKASWHNWFALDGPLDRSEGVAVSALLAAMVALPLAEIVARTVFTTGIPGGGPFVQHLTLWVGFWGAALAAKEGKLLELATGSFLPIGWIRSSAQIISATVAALVAALLARACYELVRVEQQLGTQLTDGVPVWVAQLVLPLAFGLIAWRLVWRASARFGGRAIAFAGLLLGLWLGQQPELLEFRPAWPGLLVILLATALGGPIFVALGGAALVLFMAAGEPLAAIPVETYRLAVSPTLPAIPLFTLTGFLLAEGQASLRLVAVFRAFFGWIPGGTAVVAAVVCAFFTTFTGGSGVTILALGALLFQALKADGYRDAFAVGLLTAAGSLGLLLPPALPLILYGIVAEVPIKDLFLGGIFPGLLLIGLIAAWGMREGIRTGAGRAEFSWAAARAALGQGKWELLLPVFLLVAIFSGLATLVEAAALSALYALVVQTVIHRDVSSWRQALKVLRNCAVVVGGVLVILGVAMGLTSYMVDAQIPARLLAWGQGNIESPWIFLLALHLLLLIVGCLMDIFSATVVVVPLIVPLGQAFGIDPIHLGIIFVANLELGYLTPPVGLNLFLASYRFERSLLEVCRATLPMLLILLLGVLLITYVPFLTTGIFALLGR